MRLLSSPRAIGGNAPTTELILHSIVLKFKDFSKKIICSCIPSDIYLNICTVSKHLLIPTAHALCAVAADAPGVARVIGPLHSLIGYFYIIHLFLDAEHPSKGHLTFPSPQITLSLHCLDPLLHDYLQPGSHLQFFSFDIFEFFLVDFFIRVIIKTFKDLFFL